jgi:hypothetical protein
VGGITTQRVADRTNVAIGTSGQQTLPAGSPNRDDQAKNTRQSRRRLVCQLRSGIAAFEQDGGGTKKYGDVAGEHREPGPLAIDHPKATSDREDPLQQQYQQLCRIALDAQRTELGTARSRGTHSSTALAVAQRALDKEEARLERMPAR